jgi:hypothetical protein
MPLKNMQRRSWDCPCVAPTSGFDQALAVESLSALAITAREKPSPSVSEALERV